MSPSDPDDDELPSLPSDALVHVASRAAGPEDLHDAPSLQMLESLAAGGMGEVIRAWDGALGRAVAVKVLHEGWRGSADVVEQFLQEACLAATLEHPHIPPVHQLGRREGVGPFFAMKLVDGVTLLDHLRGLPRGPVEGDALLDVIDVLVKVCDALAFAHDHGVVHGDLKTRNIMVGAHGQVYLMDWGNARPIAAPPRRSADGRPLAVGTPSLMAPEQARGEALDIRTDVFGVGALLYTVLARRPPYPRGSTVERVEAAAAGRRRSLADVAPLSPLPLRDVVHRAMSLSPGDRYQRVEHLRDDLDRFRRGRTSAPALTLRAGERLITEGDDSDAIFVVRSGHLRVTQQREGGAEELRRVGPGEVLGELGTLTTSRRSASVTALTDVEVVEITPARLQDELSRVAPWLQQVVSTMAARFLEEERRRLAAQTTEDPSVVIWEDLDADV